MPALLLLIVWIALNAHADEWPQFRGPDGAGISKTANPPVHFGATSNLLWKVNAPPGYSSPVVFGNRIFFTALNEGRLETYCLDRADGRILWRKAAPVEASEPSRDLDLAAKATPTPVTDGKSVFVLFGPYGLLAYDMDGVELWRQPIAKIGSEIAASPILIGDKLIIVSDRFKDSFIEARDKNTGLSVWHAERKQFRESRSTPFHWAHPKREELVVSGSFWLTSYDPRDGSENWRFAGTSLTAAGSPAADDDLIFVLSPEAGSASANIREPDEAPPNPNQFSNLDSLLNLPLPKPGSGLFAIQSCGRGDITASHLAWKVSRSLPAYSSPLYYKGRLYTAKTGGFVSAYDVNMGEPLFQDERLEAPGDYFASPVVAANRIYITSERGVVTVLDADATTPKILAQNKLGEETFATPALIDQTIIFRTTTNLFAFAASK